MKAATVCDQGVETSHLDGNGKVWVDVDSMATWCFQPGIGENVTTQYMAEYCKWKYLSIIARPSVVRKVALRLIRYVYIQVDITAVDGIS